MSVSGIQYQTSRVILNIMVCIKITLRTGYNATTLSDLGSSNLGRSGNLYSKQDITCHQSYPHPLIKKLGGEILSCYTGSSGPKEKWPEKTKTLIQLQLEQLAVTWNNHQGNAETMQEQGLWARGQCDSDSLNSWIFIDQDYSAVESESWKTEVIIVLEIAPYVSQTLSLLVHRNLLSKLFLI